MRVIDISGGIGFAALCIAATWLEVTGHEASGLWSLVVLWAIFGFSTDNEGSSGQ